MSLNLSKKQLNVLRTLEELAEDQGYMPSVRELASSLELSPATTQQHLNALRKKGFIVSDGRAHGIKLVKPPPNAQVPAGRKRGRKKSEPAVSTPPSRLRDLLLLPVIGRIAAGKPIEAMEVVQDELEVSPGLARPGDYVLQVEGESMIEDGIHDGDMVLIRPQEQVENGQIAVALLEDGNATLKRVYSERGRVRLQPANREMEPFYVQNLRIQGRVIGLVRLYH